MLRIVTVLLALLVPLTTTAQRTTEPTPAIPELLQPWVDWALDGHEQSLCPLRNGSGERRCTWPSRLHLDLNRDGGVFSQEWHVDAPSWVVLPGDDRAWPLDVTANGIDTVVVARSGRAAVFLGTGRHLVRGSLRWDTLPQSLAVPEDTGLLALFVDGKEIRFPERTSGGRVWLQQRSVAEARNHVGIRVFRHVLDDIPLRMTTRVELEVSGASREELLGRPLAEGFVAMTLESVLPVRIEADGRLRVQVRPGTWTIDLVARHSGLVTTLKLENPGGPWAEQEIWAFAARNDLRIVTVDNGIPVDPEQTGLPQEWRALPAYVLHPGDSLTLVEKQRGDADPAPDRLVLQRTWWLDFDGGGYTVHDEIEGTASRSWRLSMRPPARLGRVAVDAEDQLITTLPGTGEGIEVRQSDLHIAADSRIEGQVGSIDAVGWDHDVESLGGELRLGPGWRLLHATGVDRAAPTWIGSWTLFDLFVVLLVATSFARLWTRWWGCLALLALGLTYIEPEAPGATWIAVLAAEALSRVLPAGRAAGLGRALWAIAFLLLLLDVVPFSVQQAREALHPALAQPQPTQQAEFARIGAVDSGAWDQTGGSAERSFDRDYFGAAPAAAPAATKYSHEADPAARVQTGPGLPTWQWRTVSLQWNGPVDATQRVELILLAPWMSRLVNALGAVLLIALLLRVANHLRVAEKAVPLAMLVGVGLLAIAPTAQAQIPDRELIDELRTRLLRAPVCAPACADIPTLLIEARDDRLVLRMRIDAAAAVAVPLPGRASQWVAESIRLDDSPAPALASADGLTWIRLEPGRHEVLVEGRLPPRDEVQLHLPLRPHHVRTIAQGWTIAGVHEDGIADADVVLGRIADSAGAAPGVLEPATLPPFTELTRVFRLGLTWEVDSTIRRLTPPGTAVVPEVPLLPGESVTTPDVRVIDGKVLVPLAAGESERSWRSVLPLADRVQLTASEVADRTEVWQIAASPIWHVEATGIPVIHAPSPDDARLRTWRPWPGETIDLAITRPEAIAGATMTIDSSEVDVSPGLRSMDVQLSLSIRSSRGGEHAITLPTSGELQQVTLDGEAKPIRQEGRTVTLPLRPGLQHARIFWRQPQGAGARFVSPRIDLGMASVNSTITVAPPGNRWTLFTAGPGLGPTVLFWPLLAMYLLAALVLGRLPISPLNRLQWFLLGLGLTQVPFPVVLVVVAWLLLLGWRREHIAAHWLSFNALQIVMVVATLAAMGCLVFSVQRGLLGLPEMQIAGNGSSAYRLVWFQDLGDVELPRVTVFSVPLFVYRLAMLIWALWLARSLLEWLRRGWESFSTGGLWRPRRPAARVVSSGHPGT
jgi:hypothetical protein